jgi:hypothetical protein
MTMLLATILLLAGGATMGDDPRMTVSMQAGANTFNATMPGGNSSIAGRTNGGILAVDFYGHYVGFDLQLTGNEGQLSGTPAAPDASAATGGASAALTGVLWNSYGVFLGAGPAVEARATMSGSLDGSASATNASSATSWQTVVGGAAAHARVFAGHYVYFTGHAFYGAIPLSGTWQQANASSLMAFSTGSAAGPTTSGTLTDPRVFYGSLAASVRPFNWMAFTGGLDSRQASFVSSGGTRALERSSTPFVGLELVY